METASADPGDVTNLLQVWAKGDSQALERVIPAVYGELRRIARRCMSGENPGQTLQARPLTFEDAWSDLEQLDPRKAQIEDMPYFGGLTVEETAAALKISDRTVLREWETARVRLYRQLQHIRSRGV